jgi:hypothetical protein
MHPCRALLMPSPCAACWPAIAVRPNLGVSWQCTQPDGGCLERPQPHPPHLVAPLTRLPHLPCPPAGLHGRPVREDGWPRRAPPGAANRAAMGLPYPLRQPAWARLWCTWAGDAGPVSSKRRAGPAMLPPEKQQPGAAAASAACLAPPLPHCCVLPLLLPLPCRPASPWSASTRWPRRWSTSGTTARRASPSRWVCVCVGRVGWGVETAAAAAPRSGMLLLAAVAAAGTVARLCNLP